MVATRMRLSDVSNDELLAGLTNLVGEGRRIIAKTIASLAEVEERRLHLDLACSSMFDPPRQEMFLSPAAPLPSKTTPSPQQLQPLSESRYRLQMTASAALEQKLEHARRLMRHQNPDG